MLKLYFDYSQYDKRYRGQLFPLLKPFLKGEGYTDRERIEAYGVSEQDFELVDEIEKADVFVLAMSWDYYIQQNKMDLVHVMIAEAAKVNKIVWTVSLGDVGYKLPFYKHVVVFRSSGFKSKLPNSHKGMPVFIADPLKIFFETNVLDIPEYTIKPIIGFCGHANGSVLDVIKSFIKTLLKRLINVFKSYPYEFDPFFVAPFVRFQLLKRIKNNNKISANFIFRKCYRAGLNSPKIRKRTTLEYFSNIKQSQYVLCIRGAGNFSVRLYETLAMGRIPVLVNTDCLVPLDHTIDWKKHVVWVEAHEIKFISQKIVDFHAGLSKDEFQYICKSNRQLWREPLHLDGFFKHQNASETQNKNNN